MNEPKNCENNIREFLNKAEIVRDTAQQIMKDFGMFGVVINFSSGVEDAYFELHQQLITQINNLFEKNFQKLQSVLYQIDITEKDLRQTKLELPNYTEVEAIAHQIIVREFKKVMFRKCYKSKE